jgi:hypothetical protein
MFGVIEVESAAPAPDLESLLVLGPVDQVA